MKVLQGVGLGRSGLEGMGGQREPDPQGPIRPSGEGADPGWGWESSPAEKGSRPSLQEGRRLDPLSLRSVPGRGGGRSELSRSSLTRSTHGRTGLKLLLFLLGWFFFLLGAVGVVIPGLPTTPFMLLALWAFSKSSRRFHDWLFSHPLFGPPLQNWEEHRAISRPVKVFALLAMVAALAYMVFGVGVPAWVSILTASVMAYGAYFILGKPSRPPG